MKRNNLGKPPYEAVSYCEMWRLDPPYKGHTLVLTSTANNNHGLLGLGDWVEETRLYACDKDGEVPDWDRPMYIGEDFPSGGMLLVDLGYKEYVDG
jgi:hypothetical protein